MNYRHAYHAGNFADVLKHAALIGILRHLRKKETPFAVIDTHAGRGQYDLASEEARKTGEAARGIGRLTRLEALPALLGDYRELVQGFDAGTYPGSPLLAARLLRPGDRLVAIEKHPEEHKALAAALAPYPDAQVIAGDGYRALPALMPPREKRGLVLIDPPYETGDEFVAAARAVISAHRRFATGLFLLWYPRKESGAAEALAGELLNAAIPRLLRVELDIGRGPDWGEGALTATGLLVVNAPHGFATAMGEAVSFLARHLAQGGGARGSVEALAGEP